MNFWMALSFATVCLVVTIVVFATKFLFPYHRVLALVIYGIGWIFFIYSITLKKQWILRHQESVTSFFTAYWIHIVFGAVMIGIIYVFLVIFPPVKSPFIGLQDEEISKSLTEDETVILYLSERLDRLLAEAEEKDLFAVDFNNVTGEQKESLKVFWNDYLEVLLELDLLKQRYVTFYQINALTKSDLHRQAFQNGYVSFLTQHNYALRLQENVGSDNSLVTYLNQSVEDVGFGSGTYSVLESKLTDADEILRLNTGRAYYSSIAEDGEIKSLVDEYMSNIDDSIYSYTKLVAKKPLNFLEKNSAKLWFPIQKQSAIQISYVRTTNRDYHISPEYIKQHKDKFLPGDILLERREWHATNVGIPGFWTHTALHIGTLDYLDEYFVDLSSLEGLKFSDYLEKENVAAYAAFKGGDEDGFPYAVIESKRPGVVLMSLEGSANADSLGVLRVKNLDKEKHFKIIMQALQHLGKPYDYDFNFVTDDALVCSELVYKAYQDIEELSIEPQEFNGRPIVSPNEFAEKYADELDSDESEMTLVLFLDGNEKKKSVIEKGEEEFAASWDRPKWHIVNDYID